MTAITKFLGAPDDVEEHSGRGRYGRFYYTQNFYVGARVQAVEKSTEFQAWIAKSIARRAKTAATKARNLAEAEERRLEARAKEDALIANLLALPQPELIDLSRSCMHALNRAAKHTIIDRAAIYAVKNAYLVAMAVAGHLDHIEHFAIERESWHYECTECGHEWVSRHGADECFRCGGDGWSGTETCHWYIFDLGKHAGTKYRFHQPGEYVCADLAVKALEIPAHEPTQEAREVPTVEHGGMNLTQRVMLAVVTGVTEQLTEQPVLQQAEAV